MANFNTWQPQGNVVPNSGGVIFSNPNVLYDINPVVLLGHTNVFKMWCTSVNNQTIYYFESLDGLSWTAYSGNPILSAATVPRVFKVGSTYYLNAVTGFPSSAIKIYTSTDGVTFTLQNATAIVGGSSGAWDNQVYQLCLVDIVAGTWYAYYNGENSLVTPVSQMGLATSTDGIHWTKDPGNPLITVLSSNFAFFKVNGVYYGMFDGGPANTQLAPLTTTGMRNIYLLVSSSPQGPWTEQASSGNIVPVYYSATPADFSSNNSDNAIGDPSIAAAGGNLYLYYTVSPAGIATGLNGAVAFGTTLAQLVGSFEGVLNAPFSDVPSLNLSALATDSFQRADANPIGGNWTAAISGVYGAAQLASHTMQAALANTAAGIFWNALAWDADQWSQVTISAFATGSDIGVTLRQDTGGAVTFYDVLWTGTGLGAAGTWYIQKRIATVVTTLATGTSPIVNVGDTILGTAIGTTINFYWNGYLLGSASDSSIASGAPGIIVYANGAPSTSAVSAWSGGTFQAAPAITFSISGNAGQAGALVSYTGTASGSVTADGSGNYAISGLAPGTYTLTPTLAGFTFSPTSATEIYAGADITGVNFTAAADHSISGNAGEAGAAVYWVEQTSFSGGSVTADGSGNYTIPDLANGSYSVSPALVGFAFSATQIVTVSSANVTGINFTASAIVALTFTQLAADPLNGSNLNPLNPANWTVASGFQALQILSNVCQVTNAPAGENAEIYTSVAFLANQYAEAKLASLTADGISTVFLGILCNANLSLGEFLSFDNEGGGNLFLSVATGADVVLFEAVVPFSIGDVFRISAIGTKIIIYQNGTQIAGTVDASRPASGSPVIALDVLTTGTDATFTHFAAGSAHAAPSPSLGGYGMQLPILLQPGQNGYFFGSYNANKPNPHFQVTATAGDGATATINVKQQEGFTPLVGDLITVTGTTRASGAFNVSNVALIAVSLNPVTGVGTLQYASTGNAVSAADFGDAEVLNDEIPEVLANGASVAVAIQTAAGQNDNGKNIAWASSFPTAPIAVTLSLQGALFDKDSDYQTIASTTSITGDNIVISNVTQRFYRVLASGVSGAATVISKITI